MGTPLRVGLVAGEASGDTLGAGLIHALRHLAPDAQFFGVAGPKMRAAGCVVWEPSESLAVMGLFEVLRDLPRLVLLLRRLRQSFIAARPDVFVGIDAPDTNLRLARHIRAAGIPTVQYVSPQVWAWRQNRVASMHAAVDLVLCLLPFEKRFYDGRGMRRISSVTPWRMPYRWLPTLPRHAPRCTWPRMPKIVALLPGSRRGEVTRLARRLCGGLRAGWRPRGRTSSSSRRWQARRSATLFTAAH